MLIATLVLLNILVFVASRARGGDAFAARHGLQMPSLSAHFRAEATEAGKPKPKRPRLHHSRRYMTAMKLNRGLRGSTMAHLGFELEAAGWRYKVSPFAMVSIAGTASSLRRARCGFNSWGLGSCGGA